MREIGQGTAPTSETDKETFLSLRLAEPSERVKITLDERMLSIEGKRNATVDMRLNAITTMKHHSSDLVPTWLIFLGMAFIWIGYRVMVPSTYKMAFIGAGVGLIAARFLTKKPTLTIQTSSGDTHVLFGHERSLNRLSFMFNHLANNKTMAEVRAKLKALETELDGGWHDAEVLPAPILPNVLEVPQAVNHFLAEGEGQTMLADQAQPTPEWMPTHEPEPQPAPPMVGFIQSFQPVSLPAQPVDYPPDHRPAPLLHPVLVPEQTPPMHQGTHGQPQRFLPSWYNQHGAHIPGANREDVVEEEPEALELDAELFDAIDAVIEPETEPEEPTVAPVPQRETLLKPKEQASIEDSSFHPRRTRSLRPRQPRTGGILNRIRANSNEWLDRAVNGPRPMATTETSGALRAQAAAAANESNARVHDSLSEEQGGVMAAEEADRLNRRSEQLLAVANELRQSEEGALETMSFADLLSSSNEEESVNVPRLDED
ncbi:MAG: hypothetical protein CMB74_00365 [Euryarchaeota archaeon]|nr:hypothetical protein [Euryarchaeota archaeon]